MGIENEDYHELIHSSKLLLDFINEKLKGSIDNLLTFDFLQLEYDKKYGSENNFDPDDTKIAKAIYYLTWRSSLPELELKEIGTGLKYRGDTLNTFNTLFGKFLERAITIFDNELNSLYHILNFKTKCYTIGNFILLPNYKFSEQSTKRNNKLKTINIYRGDFRGWKDYFHNFLNELEKMFQNKSNILKDFKEKNIFYFKENRINTMEKFKAVNYLDLYFSNEGLLLNDIFDDGMKTFCSKNYSSFKNFSYYYISKVNEITKDRSQKILVQLKKNISENSKEYLLNHKSELEEVNKLIKINNITEYEGDKRKLQRQKTVELLFELKRVVEDC